MMANPRIVALVPMRDTSERVPGKNYRPLAGWPLFHHILLALHACPELADIVVDTDSLTIKQGLADHFPRELDDRATILEAAPAPRRRGPGLPSLLAWHHASSHTTLRSFGSWVWMSSASPGDSCALRAANTAPVTIRASRSEPSPASFCTRA